MNINDSIHAVFSDGVLSPYVNNFTYRAVQEEMAAATAASWQNGRHIIIEAGTGTGKTLGYLLPAALFALHEDITVAIVTETKALQQQLMLNDLPVAASVIEAVTGRRLEYSLCLGSSNYPCSRRLKQMVDAGSFDARYEKDIMELNAALGKDHTLTRFDLQTADQLWSGLCRESELCVMNKCRYKNKCSYMAARKRWQQSNILVMNHYLFFSNIAASKSLLPDVKGVVFDEAHSLERIASAQLGFAIHPDKLKEMLEQCIVRKKGGSFVENILPDNLHSGAIEIFDNALRQIVFSKKLCYELMKEAYTHRLRHPFQQCLPLLNALEEVLKLFEKAPMENLEENIRLEFEFRRSIIAKAWQNIGMAVYMDNESHVFWLEKEKNDRGAVSICGQPLNAAAIINREVVEYYDHLCFVSATLSVNSTFDYYKQSIGLYDADAVILSSPFDFSSQSVLFIDKNNVDPAHDGFIDAAAEKLAAIINMVQGRCLVLFTSYSMLAKMYEKIKTQTPNEIFSQHTASAATALNEYMQCPDGVLFGTHSLWQGIDLPGDLVRAVIIMRLPFEAPENPCVQAKLEKIQKEGGNPFVLYQLPNAVLLLKQGFGRLIRTSTDKGIVAILDSRIVTKSYGRLFLSSLPDAKKVYTLEDLRRVYQCF